MRKIIVSTFLSLDGVIPADFRLVDTKTSTTGVIIATYERAGDIGLACSGRFYMMGELE